MMVVRTVLAELLGLLPDDARIASAILIWVLLVGTVVAGIGLPPGLQDLVLFAGLAGVLPKSVLRQPNDRRGRPDD